MSSPKSFDRLQCHLSRLFVELTLPGQSDERSAEIVGDCLFLERSRSQTEFLFTLVWNRALSALNLHRRGPGNDRWPRLALVLAQELGDPSEVKLAVQLLVANLVENRDFAPAATALETSCPIGEEELFTLLKCYFNLGDLTSAHKVMATLLGSEALDDSKFSRIVSLVMSDCQDDDTGMDILDRLVTVATASKSILVQAFNLGLSLQGQKGNYGRAYDILIAYLQSPRGHDAIILKTCLLLLAKLKQDCGQEANFEAIDFRIKFLETLLILTEDLPEERKVVLDDLIQANVNCNRLNKARVLVEHHVDSLEVEKLAEIKVEIALKAGDLEMLVASLRQFLPDEVRGKAEHEVARILREKCESIPDDVKVEVFKILAESLRGVPGAPSAFVSATLFKMMTEIQIDRKDTLGETLLDVVEDGMTSLWPFREMDSGCGKLFNWFVDQAWNAGLKPGVPCVERIRCFNLAARTADTDQKVNCLLLQMASVAKVIEEGRAGDLAQFPLIGQLTAETDTLTAIAKTDEKELRRRRRRFLALKFRIALASNLWDTLADLVEDQLYGEENVEQGVVMLKIFHLLLEKSAKSGAIVKQLQLQTLKALLMKQSRDEGSTSDETLDTFKTIFELILSDQGDIDRHALNEVGEDLRGFLEQFEDGEKEKLGEKKAMELLVLFWNHSVEQHCSRNGKTTSKILRELAKKLSTHARRFEEHFTSKFDMFNF